MNKYQMTLFKQIIIGSILCICLASMTGCTAVPNYKITENNNSLVVPAHKFKYGKYCGAGHPTFHSKPGSNQRTEDLKSMWPPLDDIDLLCYAHDLCYQIAGSQNLICDQALSASAINNATSFSKSSGCRNLVKLIGCGLGAKVKGSEESRIGATVITVANALWTLPLSLSYHALNSSDIEKYGYPATEGNCFKHDGKNFHPYQIISDFEANFREYAKGYEKYSFSKAGIKDISIPVPILNWNKKYLISETQKYLNYYGFNAGMVDGILGNKTSKAIAKFSAKYKIESNDIIEVNKLLKQLYLSRPVKERIKVYNLSSQEKNELFGYKNK